MKFIISETILKKSQKLMMEKKLISQLNLSYFRINHLSQKKVIEGKVNSFGTLTGNFSLSEFDQLIQKTQSDLILRLSRDLKSKI